MTATITYRWLELEVVSGAGSILPWRFIVELEVFDSRFIVELEVFDLGPISLDWRSFT